MDNLKKIVISCGGTGGHFYPGLSIARRFMELGGTPLLMLSGVNVEKQTQIARGFEIPVLPLPPMPSPNRPGKIFQFIKGAATGYCKAVKTMKHLSHRPLSVWGLLLHCLRFPQQNV